MSRKCDVCGKAPVYGNNISHSHKRTRTRWLPNLKKVDAIIDSKRKKIKICMSCLHANKVEIAY